MILHLTLHRIHFDDIASGNKLFEYRDIKPYWTRRLMDGDKFKEFTEIHFVNGYGEHRPKMIVKCLGITYGTFEGRRVYAIGLGDIYSIKNYSPS